MVLLTAAAIVAPVPSLVAYGAPLFAANVAYTLYSPARVNLALIWEVAELPILLTVYTLGIWLNLLLGVAPVKPLPEVIPSTVKAEVGTPGLPTSSAQTTKFIVPVASLP